MKLQKAKEIIELNIKEASKRMPPDVKTALQISLEADDSILEQRKLHTYPAYKLLPSETEE